MQTGNDQLKHRKWKRVLAAPDWLFLGPQLACGLSSVGKSLINLLRALVQMYYYIPKCTSFKQLLLSHSIQYLMFCFAIRMECLYKIDIWDDCELINSILQLLCRFYTVSSGKNSL